MVVCLLWTVRFLWSSLKVITVDYSEEAITAHNQANHRKEVHYYYRPISQDHEAPKGKETVGSFGGRALIHRT